MAAFHRSCLFLFVCKNCDFIGTEYYYFTAHITMTHLKIIKAENTNEDNLHTMSVTNIMLDPQRGVYTIQAYKGKPII